MQLLISALRPTQLTHWLHGGLTTAVEHRARALVPDSVYELRAAISGRTPVTRSAGCLWWNFYRSRVVVPSTSQGRLF